MATSAIGPGFLNNTSLFTEQLLTSFGFVILISILLDIAAQLNIWRILSAGGKKAQDIANDLLPGLGFVLAFLVAFGGLAFNIGNIAGCGLGLQVLTGMDPRAGAAISCVIALMLFWMKEAGRWMDVFVKVLGIAMLVLMAYVMFVAKPPFAKAFYHTFLPEKTDIFMIVALVGGTVGGYISFAGIHRLMDANIKGNTALGEVSRSAVTGILLTSVMRYALFLAALGVVWNGTVLEKDNPAASVFKAASGTTGFYFFGVVLWSAAITSVVGASYTSVSFWQTLHPFIQKKARWVITAFIVISAVVFILLHQPPSIILILAGALNGLILPVGLAVMLIAATRKRLMGGYRHPVWMFVIGWIVVILMSWMGYTTIVKSLYI
ncbi:MAG: divalent metal cation transporter [Chitinophagaceae bacterium]|nr:divalent metal cation transporter [Chitinophagaceae bacterium]